MSLRLPFHRDYPERQELNRFKLGGSALPDQRESDSATARRRQRHKGEGCLTTPDCDGPAGDEPDGGPENDIAWVVAVLLQARAADQCGESVRRNADTPPEVAMQYRGRRERRRGMARRERESAAVRALAPDAELDALGQHGVDD